MAQEFIDLIMQILRDKSLFESREEVIRQGVILPFLAQIGWNPYNIHEVLPEYRVENGRVDYCLKIKDKKRVFIEVKRVAEDLERHEKQLLEYSFSEGLEIAVLTNGLVWLLYLPLAGGTWQQRKFFTIDIKQQNPDTVIKNLERYLSKSAINDGSALRAAREVHASREKENRVKETLPQAWDKLLSEPDSRLIDLLAETVESMCGHQPDLNIVSRFILNAQKEKILPQPQPSQTTDAKKQFKRQVRDLKKVSVKPHESSSTRQKGIVIIVDGITYQGNVREVYTDILKYLVDNAIIDRIQSQIPFKTSGQRYLIAKSPVHPGGDEFVRPVEYKGYYLESHKSYKTAMDAMKMLLTQCGLSLEVVKNTF